VLQNQDPFIWDLLSQEEQQQKNFLNFIASENYAHPAVRAALGSVLTNVYAEGYPGKRYYPGCQVSDQIETTAIERCKKLFNADHANVQPHSGSQANMAVFFSVLETHDVLMGMDLACGGHLTHGHNVNFSGTMYKSIPYTVDPITEHIDYDALEALAELNKPKLIIAGGSSYSRIVDYEKFRKIADAVGAYLLVDIAHTAGLIISGIFPNPTPYADFITGTTQKTLLGPRGGFILCKKEHQEKIDRAVFPGVQGGPCLNTIAAKAVAFGIVEKPDFKEYMKKAVSTAKSMARTFEKLGYRVISGGTDSHLFVIDLTAQKCTGRVAEKLLERVGILVSRSAIPFDPQKPLITSGIRLGTLAFTSRNLSVESAIRSVELIDTLLQHQEDESRINSVAQEVLTLSTASYPL